MRSKHIVSIVLIVFVVFSIILLVNKETREVNSVPFVEDTGDNAIQKTIVYYFHMSKRCVNCIFIENNTKETIAREFSEEIKNGSLEMQIINVSDPENRHYIEDYELITQSVVLVEKKGNQEIRKKKLDDIWELVGDVEPFTNYIFNETNSFLLRG
jgi:hypothetical protein